MGSRRRLPRSHLDTLRREHSTSILDAVLCESSVDRRDGSLGVGSSSPWGRLAVNPGAGDANQFVVGSSTQTSFVIAPNGNVGIGTSSPYGLLSLFAASTSNSLSLFNISSTTSNYATTTLFSIGNTGSTTASNGFNIAAGCFAIGGNCLSLG